MLQDSLRVELYLDSSDPDLNKRYFDALESNKEEIERSFGATLRWQRLNDKRASRISYKITEGGLKDEDSWPDLHTQMITAMIALEKAFKPHIMNL